MVGDKIWDNLREKTTLIHSYSEERDIHPPVTAGKEAPRSYSQVSVQSRPEGKFTLNLLSILG